MKLPTPEPGNQSPPWSVPTKAIVASAAIVVGALAVWRFQALIAPLAVAAILAYLLNPLINWVQRRTRLSRGKAVLLIYVGLVLVLIGAGVALGFVAFDQTSKLLNVLPTLIPRLMEQTQVLSSEWSHREIALGPYRFSLSGALESFDWEALADEARNSIQPVVTSSGSVVATVARATVATIGMSLLVFVVSIYMAVDVPRLGQVISDVAHQPGYRRDAERLMNETILIWNAYLRGQILLALIIGVVVSVSLGILGVSNFLALGLLSGVLEFLPIVGPSIGTLTAVLVAVFQGDNYFGLSPLYFGLIVLAVMIVIQGLENNLIVPRIVGDALDLHPLAVMIGVLVGTSLAGLLGAILAAPVLATLKLLGVYVWRKMLDLPPFLDAEPPLKEDQAKDESVGYGQG